MAFDLGKCSPWERGYRLAAVASVFGCVVYPLALQLIALALLTTSWWRWGASLLAFFAVLAAVPLCPRPKWAERILRDAMEASSDWLSLKVIVNQDKFTEGPYIIGLEPHSVIPVMMPAMMNTLSEALPKACQPCFCLATAIAFWMPVVKHWWWWIDVRSASRESMAQLLRSGSTVCLTPGGVRECLYMEKDKEVAYLRRRLGFVRMAMQNGVPLVPAFAFGQTQLYHYIRPGPPLVPQWVLERFSRAIGFVPMVMWGTYGTTLPLRRACTVVMGDPIHVPKVESPGKDQCQLYLDKFIASLQELVEKHKAEAGHPDLDFSVI